MEKIRSKLLRSIAFFLYVVTVRTEVKCAAVVLHKKRKQENVNDAPSHYGVQMNFRSQRARSGACKLDDDTKIAEEREVNGNEHPCSSCCHCNKRVPPLKRSTSSLLMKPPRKKMQSHF